MKICVVGGSGIISTSVTHHLLAQGHSLTCVTRGRRPLPDGVTAITMDHTESDALTSALRGEHFDAVIDFLVFDAHDASRALSTWTGRTNQYVFISSASCYKKPTGNPVMTESTPLGNPHWEYSRKKIDAELVFQSAERNQAFPLVIVRPSLTYGDSHVPLILNSWAHPYTLIHRMKLGLPIVIPGDGASLWTITHADDFALGLGGLLGNPNTIGQAFHITSDEHITWHQAFTFAATAFETEFVPVMISSHTILKAYPDWEGTTLGDKAVSVIFDNTKIKQFVPGFVATIGFAEGMRRVAKWFSIHPESKTIDALVGERHAQLARAYQDLESTLVTRIRAAG